MKALRFNSFGELTKVLHTEEIAEPTSGPDDALVQVHAASINPSDVKNVQGKMSVTTLPRTPGQDFSGIVIAGDQHMIGKEVWGTGGDIGFTRDGSHAEYILVPRRSLQLKPTSLSMVEAASVGRNYIAAFVGLEKTKPEDGETILITGASGGVGSSVVKLAKLKNVTVIGVDRKVLDPDKARRQGIDFPLSSQSEDILSRVKEITQGRGVNVSFDCVGGPLFEIALNSLGMSGRQVNIASVGERRVSFDLIDFYHRRLTLFGIDTISLDVISSGEILEQLRPAFEQGRLTPPDIGKTYLLDNAVEAYREMDSGVAKGKIVFTFPH